MNGLLFWHMNFNCWSLSACAAQADVCFVVDSSGSIRDNNPAGATPGGPTDNWTLLLEFVSEIIGAFAISERDTHIGVVLFSTDVMLRIKLTDFYDKAQLQSQVKQLDYIGGFTNTADALRVTREQCFSASNGNRQPAPDLAIIITDGVPTLNTASTEPEANALKNAGVEVIAVGITNSVDTNTLRLLSSSPQRENENYFAAPNFNQLGDILDRIIVQACVTESPTEHIPGTYFHCLKPTSGWMALFLHIKSPVNDTFQVSHLFVDQGHTWCTVPTYPLTPVLRMRGARVVDHDLSAGHFSVKDCVAAELQLTVDCCSGLVSGKVCFLQADFCFVIDSSGSICDGTQTTDSCGNWILLLSFVRDVIGAFTIGERHTRVGVVTFSNDASLAFPLDQYFNAQEVKDAILSIEHLGGLTNTGKALHLTRTECFNRNNGEREGTPNIAVVITDGLPTVIEYNTNLEASSLKRMATVLAVGITNLVEKEFLKEISSAPQIENENYFSSPDFSELGGILSTLVTETCQAPLKTTVKPIQGNKKDFSPVIFVIPLQCMFLASPL